MGGGVKQQEVEDDMAMAGYFPCFSVPPSLLCLRPMEIFVSDPRSAAPMCACHQIELVRLLDLLFLLLAS